MHIYTSSFFKFRNKANFYSFLGASAGTGAPRNTQKIGTQCGCEYGYKNYESFGSLIIIEVHEMFVIRRYCPNRKIVRQTKIDIFLVNKQKK